MKNLLVFAISILLIYSCKNESPKTAPPQKTDVTKNSGAEEVKYGWTGEGDECLYATVNGKVVVIVDSSEHKYVQVDTVLDYDNDGDLDALALYSESGGGNCCANNYFVITNMGNGKFIRSVMTEGSFSSPTFNYWKGQNTLVVKSSNEGINTDDYQETIYRYAITNGNIKQIEAIKTAEIPAVAEIRSSEFSFEEPQEIRTLVYDLDGDNVNDTIQCSFWDRWGMMIPSFYFSKGTVCEETGLSAKRIGVLESKTHGVNDLVFDLNTIMKWDGKKYDHDLHD